VSAKTKAPTSADVLGASPRVREYDLDNVDATIQADGGAPCRRITFLAAGAGTIVLTMASPFDDSLTEPVTITNLQGRTVEWSCANITKGTAAGVKLAIEW
jgi:hypothetical protein